MTPSPVAILFLVAIPAAVFGITVWRTRISDHARDKGRGAKARAGQPDEKPQAARDRLTFNLPTKPPESDRHATERRHGEQIAWTKYTARWVGAYTIVTAVIAALSTCQLQTAQDAAEAAKIAATAAKSSADANIGQLTEMRESGRAWVSPTNATLDRPISAGFPLGFHVLYQNTGREPALALNQLVISDTFSNVPPIQNWDNIPVRNDTCDHVDPREGGQVVYPSGGQVLGGNAYSYDARLVDKPFAKLIYDAVVAKTVVFYVKGCFAYTTVNKIHKSGFCYFLRPPNEQIGQQWEFKICPKGNSAN